MYVCASVYKAGVEMTVKAVGPVYLVAGQHLPKHTTKDASRQTTTANGE